jgi:signal transduction histidine kinase
MIPLPDLVSIVGISLVAAAGVGALGLAALRLTRRATMLVQLWVIVATTVVSVVVGMVAAAQAMYVSSHDLLVLLYIAGASGFVSLMIALLLGRAFARNSTRLQLLARALGDGTTVAPGATAGRNTEFTSLETELAQTSRRLADAREQLEALEQSRQEFFAWISHDLRTPLAGLRAMAEALDDELAADPRRFHRQMLSQVDHLSSMVDDIFELSKIHSGTLALTMEPISLYDLVSDVVAELNALAKSRSVTLTESRSGEFTVAGDPRELSRVIGNLLINAIQHSPPGGVISVATLQGEDGDVVVTVEDAGGGIPEQDLAKVFTAGWRATPSRTPDPAWSPSAGAGLGLAIVQGIVEAHAGAVSVRNVPGGCRFDVSLPRYESVAA